jgi:hypothetical protein
MSCQVGKFSFFEESATHHVLQVGKFSFFAREKKFMICTTLWASSRLAQNTSAISTLARPDCSGSALSGPRVGEMKASPSHACSFGQRGFLSPHSANEHRIRSVLSSRESGWSDPRHYEQHFDLGLALLEASPANLGDLARFDSHAPPGLGG